MAFEWLQRMPKYLRVRPFSLQPMLRQTLCIQGLETNTDSNSQCLKSKSTIILYDQSFLAACVLQRTPTRINGGKKSLDPPRDPIHQVSSSPTFSYGGYLHKAQQSFWKREEKDIVVTVAKFSHRECTSKSHHSAEELQKPHALFARVTPLQGVSSLLTEREPNSTGYFWDSPIKKKKRYPKCQTQPDLLFMQSYNEFIVNLTKSYDCHNQQWLVKKCLAFFFPPNPSQPIHLMHLYEHE